MTHSSLASMGRHATALLASLSIFAALDASAQNVAHYYRVDKTLLEDFISTDALVDEYQFLIVDETAGMAIQPTLTNNNASLPGVPVTINDGHIDTDNTTIYFKFIYIGKSKTEGGLEFRIIEKSNRSDFLGAASGIFSLKDANQNASSGKFTFFFDEVDNSRFQIQSTYSKSGSSFYSIVYTGAGAKEGFKLVEDDTKSLSLYRIDILRPTFLKERNTDINKDLELTLYPNNDFYKPAVCFKYILNNGENVTMADLLASEHSTQVSWSGYNKNMNSWSVSLPNYDAGATTLWAVPMDPDTNIPAGPIVSAVYAANNNDISTGINDITSSDIDTSAQPAYYTLQGVRVAEPSAPGIYIRRQGTSATKIILK